MTNPFHSSHIPPDLLAYIGWQGVRYVLLKTHIERVDAGIATDAPPEVVAHWRRLGGVEVMRVEFRQLELWEAA